MEILLTILFVAGAVFFTIPLMTVIYGCTAWVVGFFFGNIIAETTMLLFNTDIDLRTIGYFNIGATLGFFGGFIRSTTTNNSSK